VNLTGFPSEIIYHDQVEVIEEKSVWSRFKTWTEEFMPIVASVNSAAVGENEKKIIKETALIDHHAYTMMQAREVFVEGELRKYVQLRCPYGPTRELEWEPAWEEKSQQIVNEVKELLEDDGEVDGIFWMTFEDYLQYFYQTTICLYRSNY
jgi:hypothetical protein